jgi:hypothetical protein
VVGAVAVERCGDREATQKGGALVLVLVHASEHVVEVSDGVRDVGPFVEHDALGPARPGGVGDLRSGRDPSFANDSATWVAQIVGTCAAVAR